MKGREIPVVLEWYEARLAASVGVARQVEAVRKGLADQHGYDGDPWPVHIHGAAGELAFAKAAGLYWAGHVNVFSVPDVGDVHVRTRSGVGGREDLIIRPSDAPDAVYVLVVGMNPKFSVVGWMRGGAARRDSWAKTHGGRPSAWFVPRSETNSFPIDAS